jgi:hypothetical protein
LQASLTRLGRKENHHGKEEISKPVASYRRKKKSGKAFIGVLAGLFIARVWRHRPVGYGNLAAPGLVRDEDPHPNPDAHPHPETPTNTATHTPTITETPTITPTFTPLRAVEYVVQRR